MEEKTFVKELEESYNKDAKIILMKEMMERIIDIIPIQGLKFIHTSSSEASDRLEKAIEALVDDKDLDQDSFRKLLMDLCFSLTVYRQQQRMIAIVYNKLKSDEEDPIVIDQPAEAEPEDDDDDRTK